MEAKAFLLATLLWTLPLMTAARPNIIIMQPDDFEFVSSWTPPAHFASTRGPAPTLDLPNIEMLRMNGLEMLRAYAASPACGTSRYSTITGRFPSRSAFSRERHNDSGDSGSSIGEVSIPTTKLVDVDSVADGMDCSNNNLAALFQANGYRTGVMGKWHLHPVSIEEYSYTAIQQDIRMCGFDTAEGIYFENLNDDWTNNGQFTHNMEHLTEEAIKFMDQADADGEEFFLYFNPTAPHASGNVLDALNSDCRNAPQGTLEQEPVVDGMTGGDIGCTAYRQSVIERGNGDVSNAVLGSIWVDDAVGALYNHLVKLGKLDSTFFLFQMDHGQEAKGSLYEPGVRIAQFIHYPDEFAPTTKYSGLVSTIDIGPTIASYAEITTGLYPMDGKSWKDDLGKEEGENRCLVLEFDFDRTVVCDCDKYISIGDTDRSSTISLGDSRGLDTSTFPASYNLCDNGRDYTHSPRLNGEATSVAIDGLMGLVDLYNCHVDMTNPLEPPGYGTCDVEQTRTPSPTTATLYPTQPTEAARLCSCTTDVSTDEAFYSEEVVSGDRRIIRTNGVPTHEFHTERERSNPNPVCLHPSELDLPATPELRRANTFTPTELGVIGILKTGAFLYNHQSNRNGIDDVANHPNNEQPALDKCHGHAGATCLYHYHEISQLSECTHDDQWDECELIGYLRDGFPIYSHCSHPTEDRFLTSCFHLIEGEDGDDTNDYIFDASQDDCDLDLANGYDFTGKGITDADGEEITGYGYIVSTTYPYVMTHYRGRRFYPIREISEAWRHRRCFGSNIPFVGFLFSFGCDFLDWFFSFLADARDFLFFWE